MSTQKLILPSSCPALNRAKLLRSTDQYAEVFYLDYGDVAQVKLDEIRVLRSDYAAEIPFQAVECLIAAIQPAPYCGLEQTRIEA